ncbi:S8 family serine peptidase [Jejudonia soesokkakensis]|uniref:S8 family serine peptidase n=1 Tax=Jejudonia soesokkakensis TaxID=1323432 RepID=A0ABW2MV70_9FLAO
MARLIYFILSLVCMSIPDVLAQSDAVVLDTVHMYIRTLPNVENLEFTKTGGIVLYTGNDPVLATLLKDETILEFKKGFPTSQNDKLKRTYSVKVVTPKINPLSEEQLPNLKKTLIREASHIFEFGEVVADTTVKVYYPNDYGTTIKGKKNLGYDVSMAHYDYLGMPQAWAYTTGFPEIIIGIADEKLPKDHPDFKDKTIILRESVVGGGHGYSVGANAVAQGDNAYGIAGVCYDCDVFGSRYGSFSTFDQLLELSQAGAKILNCSFVTTKYYETAQEVINEMYDNGTIIVASAGNRPWSENYGKKLYYPASYENVISVSSVTYKYETPYDNFGLSSDGNYYAQNIKNYLGRSLGFTDNNPEKEPYIYLVSTPTLNPMVDIVAPGVLVFSFGNYLLKPEYIYNKYQSTSMAAPLVAGTLGLMFSLYPELPLPEAESILKITSTNINEIEGNKPFAGHYGAGALHTGRAVKMVNDLISPTETLTVENQDFNRWDFILTALSESVVIQNQTFREEASLRLTSKNKIVLKPGTRLQSTNKRGIVLAIDPTLSKK